MVHVYGHCHLCKEISMQRSEPFREESELNWAGSSLGPCPGPFACIWICILFVVETLPPLFAVGTLLPGFAWLHCGERMRRRPGPRPGGAPSHTC